MRAQRTIVTAGLLALMLLPAQLLRPTVASAHTCITTVAGDTCLAACIGTLQLGCGSDPACHQAIAADLKLLASTPAEETDVCAALVAAARQTCGCP
jgi:hypothetical protein